MENISLGELTDMCVLDVLTDSRYGSGRPRESSDQYSGGNDFCGLDSNLGRNETSHLVYVLFYPDTPHIFNYIN